MSNVQKHWLSFMGVEPPEEFRCRIYASKPSEPMTREQARAWLLSEAADGGVYPPNCEPWGALIDEMEEAGEVHWYLGRVHLGPDFKRPNE